MLEAGAKINLKKLKKHLHFQRKCNILVNGHAGVAQSVAHFIGSEEVTGSIPVASLSNYKQRIYELLQFIDTLFLYIIWVERDILK